MSIDRLSNMLSAIKNAAAINSSNIEVYYSKECEGVAKVLEKAGYLENVKTFKEKGKSYKKMRLDLALEVGESKIAEVKRISKPGRRLYKSSSEIGSVLGGQGVTVLTTSRGIMSGAEAKRKKLGGEIICEVY